MIFENLTVFATLNGCFAFPSVKERSDAQPMQDLVVYFIYYDVTLYLKA